MPAPMACVRPRARSWIAGALGLAALLASGGAGAEPDALEDLRTTLRQFTGRAALKATLERAVTSERKDRPIEAGRVTLEVSAGPGGISVDYPAGLLEQIRTERVETDPEKPRPVRRTLDGFDAIDVADMLNAAAGLLSDLDGAVLKGAAEAEYQGQPARVLELELPARISKADRKWLKSSRHTLKLWTGTDGVPLAAESDFSFTVGLLIFTFEARELRTQAFARVHDRLVALHRATVFDGEGLGESQHIASDTTLRLQQRR